MTQPILRTLLATVLLLGVASTASAQEARELFTQGQAAYETGDYDTAVARWERAYELDPRPLLQYNLAQAYERLGFLDRAVAAYRVYVENTPGEDARAQNARARIASLETRLTRTSILLTGGVEGARVTIDGEDRGLLPHPDPFRVEPGSHRIVVRAEGYEDFVSSVAVSGGQAAELAVEMRQGATGNASDTVDSGGGGGIWLPGVIIAAGGGAALIAGAVLGGLALGDAGNAPGPDSDEADSARTLALVADILMFGGGAIAVAGLILMFVIQEEGDSTALVPVVGPDYAGAAFSASF